MGKLVTCSARKRPAARHDLRSHAKGLGRLFLRQKVRMVSAQRLARHVSSTASISQSESDLCYTPPETARRSLFPEPRAPVPRRFCAAASPPSPPPLLLARMHGEASPCKSRSWTCSPLHEKTAPRLSIAGFLRDLRLKENVYLSNSPLARSFSPSSLVDLDFEPLDACEEYL